MQRLGAHVRLVVVTNRRKVSIRRRYVVAMLLAAAVTVGASSPASASPKLAFGRDGKHPGLYVIGIDSGRPERISHRVLPGYLSGLYEPAWSPDGTRVAFTGRRHDVEGTFVVRSDGSHQIRLSKAPCYAEYTPDWSPDSRRIVFRHDSCERSQIWTVRRDGRHRTRLRHAVSFGPRWNPQHPLIAYTERHRPEDQIYLMRPDGSHVRQLTTTPGANEPRTSIHGNRDPVWFSDGETLAYAGSDQATEKTDRDVCIVKKSGLANRCLSHGDADDFDPVPSPNGRWVAYVSARNGNEDVLIVNRAGSKTRRIASSAKRDFDPVWSPDGRWIAFLSARSGHVDLYIVHPDGSGLRRLTHTPAAESRPAWAPR